MIQYEKPYTQYDIDNVKLFEPWLLKESESTIISINEILLTATNIWNYKNREELINDVFEHYRSVGFPYHMDCNCNIKSSLNKLKTYSIVKCGVNEESKIISNSSYLGLDCCRHYNRYNFWNAKGDDDSNSVVDIFNNDEEFIKVLKNRMGWNTSSEGGNERPYVFSISDKMIIQGIHSTGKGYNVSNFKPLIARYFGLKFNAKKILDYSAGWGARMLGFMSNHSILDNVIYHGIDPMTADDINKMIDDLELSDYAKVIKGCSEDIETYKTLDNDYDLIFSCPPYFTLEKYNDDDNQSYNKFNNYKDWLNEYWKPTVINCYDRLIEAGKFVLIMKETYKKFNILDDMKNICEDCGLKLIDVYSYNTCKSHLSGKSKSKITNKNSEKILVFKRLDV